MRITLKLDIRKFAKSLIANQSGWCNVDVSRVVYCTARISGASNPSGQRNQDVYLRALKLSGAVDVIAMGNYVSRTTTAPLATADKRGKPVIARPAWPIMVKENPNDGVGQHWWYRMQPADLFNAQLPNQIGHITRPPAW